MTARVDRHGNAWDDDYWNTQILYTSWGQSCGPTEPKVPDMASILAMKRNRKQAQKRRRRQALTTSNEVRKEEVTA